MISRTAEYALQAIVCLARKGEKTGLSTEAIAKLTQVPPSYLVKVLGLLARSGLVRSQRGLYGGYTLAQGPGELTFLDIINAVDPIRRITQCPVQPQGASEQLCPLHEAIDRAITAVEHEFASVKVIDLVQMPGEKAPLCGCSGKSKTSALRKQTIGKIRAKRHI